MTTKEGNTQIITYYLPFLVLALIFLALNVLNIGALNPVILISF